MIKTRKYGNQTFRIRKINGETYIYEGKYELKALADKAVKRLKSNKDIRTRIIKSGKLWYVWYYNMEGKRIEKKEKMRFNKKHK